MIEENRCEDDPIGQVCFSNLYLFNTVLPSFPIIEFIFKNNKKFKESSISCEIVFIGLASEGMTINCIISTYCNEN